MWTELAGIAATQGGVFTRAQARAAGYRGPALRQLTRPGGDWVVVRRGVYAERQLWERLDGQRERPLAIARAVSLAMRVEHVISHDSAAHAWGLPLIRPALPLVHVTRPGVLGSRTEHGVKHHLERRGLDATYDLEGLVVTGLERTAVDVAREHGWLAGVVAMDGALRLGASPVLVEAVLAGMWSWPGVRQARRATQLSRIGADSALETLGRLMLAELGMPEGIPQFPVAVRGGVAWCDLLVGCHVFEFDGRRKYVDHERGGVATRPAEAVVWDEKLREVDVRSNGLGLSRHFWHECWGAGRRAGLERMRAEYDATCRRLGTVPPVDVLAFADRMTEQRERWLRRADLRPAPVPRPRERDLWRRAG